MEEEVIQEYCSSLEELTANSKPIINMLTMLAEDNEQYAPEIVKVIETHLQQVYLILFMILKKLIFCLI